MVNLEQKIRNNKLLGTKLIEENQEQKIIFSDGSKVELPIDGQRVRSMAIFPDLKYGGHARLVVGTTSCCSAYLVEYYLEETETGYAPFGKPKDIYHAPTNVSDIMPVILKTNRNDSVTRMGYLIIGDGCNGSGAYLMGEKGEFEQIKTGEELGSSRNKILSAKEGKVFTSVAALRYPDKISDEVKHEIPKVLCHSNEKVEIGYESYLIYNSEKAASVAPEKDLLARDLTDKLKDKIKFDETENLQTEVDKFCHTWYTKWK